MTVLSTMPSWFYDKLSLRRTPSILNGIDPLQESRYRKEGARFIINIGTNMGLRYDTMATGVVYFHRFYMFHTFKLFPRYITACCCLFLAGKVEETPKKCKDIIKHAKLLLNETQFMQFGEDPKEEIMTLERILLQTIKFDLQVEHPYGHLLRYAKCLKGDKKMLEKLVQMAWTFINDSLCTTLSLQWEPEIIAIALMYLAGKLSKFVVTDWNDKTPRHAHWWDMYVQDLTIDVLEDICHQVLDLYSSPAANPLPESPPATPPSKSNIRKVAKPPPSVPVVMAAQSSSPVVTKPKDVPVGQPIPRLEPGELKRKVAKLAVKKEGPEAKIQRLANSSFTSQPSTSASSSPRKLLDNQEKKVESETKTPIVGHSIPTIETAYHTGMSASASAVTKAEPIKTIITTTSVEHKSEKVSAHKSLYVPPESIDTFYTESNSTLSFSMTSSYVTPPPPVTHDPSLITPVPQQSTLAQYEDMYRPPLAPVNQPPLPPPQAQYPPPPANIHPIPQYPAPPLPQPTIMPSMSMPPPTMSQLPPPVPTTSNIRNEHMHASVSHPPPAMPHNIMPPQNIGPRVSLPSQNVNTRPPPMPPQNIGPRLPLPRPAFRPRTGSNPENYGFDLQHLGEQRSRMPSIRGPRPPRYMTEGPVRQDYSHFDHDRSMPPYRPDVEYENNPYVEYDDYGAGRGQPVHPFEFDNMRRRYGNMEPHLPRNLERPPPPSMLGNRPRMESPTGIPPVRITGSCSSYNPYLE